MPESARNAPRPLDQYRKYLRFLAGLKADPLRSRSIEPSDLVQQTLFQAYRHRDTFRGATDGEFRAWLRAILAQQLAQSARRARPGTGESRSLEETSEPSSARPEAWLVADESSPSQRAMRAERLRELASALAQLPEDQRIALQLRYLRGLPVVDVARQMGRGAVSVTGLIYRGTRALRELLSEAS